MNSDESERGGEIGLTPLLLPHDQIGIVPHVCSLLVVIVAVVGVGVVVGVVVVVVVAVVVAVISSCSHSR